MVKIEITIEGSMVTTIQVIVVTEAIQAKKDIVVIQIEDIEAHQAIEEDL